jgi:hypothetical protein
VENTQSVLKWFQGIQNKCDYSFLSFDVNEFYPSISVDLLNSAISWARTITNITPEEESVIKHARKSLLFHGDKTWSKTNYSDGAHFDVAMGSYDGAEVCELVGLFILNTLASRFGNDMVGLYRDDGLMLVKGSKGRSADKARKELHRIFDQFGLKITADVCHQSVNFLDVTLNLKQNNFTPYRKPNNDPIYIDSRSNHPPSIIRQLPK